LEKKETYIKIIPLITLYFIAIMTYNAIKYKNNVMNNLVYGQNSIIKLIDQKSDKIISPIYFKNK
jgi:hypothetical protein